MCLQLRVELIKKKSHSKTHYGLVFHGNCSISLNGPIVVIWLLSTRVRTSTRVRFFPLDAGAGVLRNYRHFFYRAQDIDIERTTPKPCNWEQIQSTVQIMLVSQDAANISVFTRHYANQCEHRLNSSTHCGCGSRSKIIICTEVIQIGVFRIFNTSQPDFKLLGFGFSVTLSRITRRKREREVKRKCPFVRNQISILCFRIKNALAYSHVESTPKLESFATFDHH